MLFYGVTAIMICLNKEPIRIAFATNGSYEEAIQTMNNILDEKDKSCEYSDFEIEVQEESENKT